MTNIPDDGHSYDYFVVFYMQGIERPFEYEVSRNTSERVRESLDDDEPGNLIFEAYRPAEQVVLNSRFLQLAQFRWTPKKDGDGSSAEGERSEYVSFYFAGRKGPVSLAAQDPQEVFDLLLAMETEAFPRCSFVDAEGEEAVLDLRKLICAEFPLGLTDRGGAQALFEIEEEV